MATKTWNPTSGNAASTDANWVGGAKPSEGDDIVFAGATSTANCTWDLTGTGWGSAFIVASITMDAAYSGTVDKTGVNLVVTGSVTMANGLWKSGQSGWFIIGGDLTTSSALSYSGFAVYEVNVVFYGTNKAHTIACNNADILPFSGLALTGSGSITVTGTLTSLRTNGILGGADFGTQLGDVGGGGSFYVPCDMYLLSLNNCGNWSKLECTGTITWYPSSLAMFGYSPTGPIYAAKHVFVIPWGAPSTVPLTTSLELYGPVEFDVCGDTTNGMNLNISGKLIIHGSCLFKQTKTDATTHTISGTLVCGALTINAANATFNISGSIRYSSYTYTAGTVNITGSLDRAPYPSEKGDDGVPCEG